MSAKPNLKELSSKVTLGTVVRSRAGKTPARGNARYWGGGIPWLTAKDLKRHRLESSLERITTTAVEAGAPLAAPNDVLILVRGMTLLKDVPVGRLVRSASFNQDVRCLRPARRVDGAYLAYVLAAGREQLRALVTQAGHGTGRLDADALMAWVFHLPPKSIQRWLVHHLEQLDETLDRIESLVTAKRAFKRALMNDLLTGRRRFPEFVRSSATQWSRVGQVPTDWGITPLSSLTERLTRRNAANSPTVLTCSGEQGLVDQTTFFTKSVASESRESYFLLHRGDFAYNRSSMKGYPFGATKRLDRYDAGAVSTLNICFSLRPGAVDSDFLVHYFESGLLNRQLGRIARVGSRAHGLLNVTMDDFYSIELSLPGKDEQQAIATVLGKLDQEVEMLGALYAEHQALNRGLMQRLLSGEIEIPEHLTAATVAAEAGDDDS